MSYLGAIFMTFMGSLGAFFFKKCTKDNKGILSALKNWNFYAGGTFYALGALLNIMLLRYFDYTVLYPMTAITYIWTLLLSRIFIGEKIEKKKIMGILAICSGVFFVSR